MQILKPLLIVCVAVCAFAVHGADNARQAKAREALNKLQGATPQAAQPATVPAPPEPAAPKAPPPPAQPAPAAVTPSPTSTLAAPETNLPPSDPEAITKAREALRQKMQDLQPGPAGVVQVPPLAPTPPPPAVEPARQPAPTPTVPPPVQAPPPVQPPPPAIQTTAQPETAPPPPVDSESIAKAREAMRKQMEDVVAKEPPEPPPPAQIPAPAVTTTAPVATQPPPSVPAPPPVATPTVQPPIQPALPMAEEADPAAIAKAREALRLKMQQMNAEQPAPPATVQPSALPVTQAPPAAPTPAPPPVTPPPPVVVPPPTAAVQPPVQPAFPMAGETDAASVEKAREAVRMKMQTLPPPVEEPQGAEGFGYTRKPARVTAPMNFPPMAGPASPISPSKQQQLDALLLQYKADQITPEQYHTARAKILGEQ